MILKSEKLLKYMEDQSISMTVTDILDNFMRRSTNLKVLQNPIVMTNGLQQRSINGYLKKMLK